MTQLFKQSSELELSRLRDVYAYLIAGLLSFLVFARIPINLLSPNFFNEFVNHATLLTQFEREDLTPYSTWYVIQAFVLGNARDEQLMIHAGLLILGALAFAKGVVLTGLLMAAYTNRVGAVVMGFLLGTAVAFPRQRWSPYFDRATDYVGTLPPNVFMSSTQLLANIFTVIAVVALCLWFSSPTTTRLINMAGMGFLAVAAKPGIAPPWIATIVALAGAMVLLGRQNMKSALIGTAVSSLAAGLPLLLSFRDFMDGSGWQRLSTQFMPLETWTAFSDNWFLDLVASWAFPLSVVVLLFASGNFTRSRANWLVPSWLFAIGATLAFALLAEVTADGITLYYGNLAWGAMSATSGLYLTSAIALRHLSFRLIVIPLLILIIQSLTGLAYINRYIETGIYL